MISWNSTAVRVLDSWRLKHAAVVFIIYSKNIFEYYIYCIMHISSAQILKFVYNVSMERNHRMTPGQWLHYIQFKTLSWLSNMSGVDVSAYRFIF